MGLSRAHILELNKIQAIYQNNLYYKRKQMELTRKIAWKTSRAYQPELLIKVLETWDLLSLRFLRRYHQQRFANNYNNHHHHVVPPARISLTLSRHFSLSFIAFGRSSGLYPVSSHSCCMFVRAGRPAFAWP